MYKLLTKEVEFSWTFECDEAFLKLKKLLTIAPVLQDPNWNLPFHIYTDASNYAIGAVLGQQSENIENTIYYISKSLHGPELNYTVVEKELLAIFMP